MSRLSNLIQKTVTEADIITTYDSDTYDLQNCVSCSVQAKFTVTTPSNKTFESTDVNTTDDEVTVTAHGMTTGLAVTLTTSGALPTGLALATTYYLIVVDANTLQFASSLNNAIAGTAINLTAAGSGTNTINVTALAGASIILQKSNDAETFDNEGSATNVTSTSNIWLSVTDPSFRYVRFRVAITSGQLDLEADVFAKGYDS